MIVCRYVLQKINGWKIYHLAAGMEDIVDMESELSKRLQEVRMMHKRMKTLIEEDKEEDEDEEDGCIVDEDTSSQIFNVDKDAENVFLQTGRRLEEAANGEVGKELGKVEFL